MKKMKFLNYVRDDIKNVYKYRCKLKESLKSLRKTKAEYY